MSAYASPTNGAARKKQPTNTATGTTRFRNGLAWFGSMEARVRPTGAELQPWPVLK